MGKMVKYYKGDLVEFEVFKLVDFYDTVLRQPTVPVKFDTLEEQKRASYLAFSLAETLNAMKGLGLSANQVGLRDRVCAINMGEQIWTMFNPEIIERSETVADYSEGCLSYPGLYLKLNRPDHIKVRFQAIGGQIVEHEFDGLTAVCIQHEIDHLDGKVFTESVSPIKLEQAKRKVKSNLKKLRKFDEEYAKHQEAAELAEPPKEEIAYNQPTIKILEDTPAPAKESEKFVYKVG
jgi:peptide deformylase